MVSNIQGSVTLDDDGSRVALKRNQWPSGKDIGDRLQPFKKRGDGVTLGVGGKMHQ